MFWLGLILGVFLGAGGYFLFDKYAGTVEMRINKLQRKLARLRVGQ
jgi:hypothetical protein